MARQQISLKQLAIDKDNATIAIVIGVATFITVFSIVASKSLIEQGQYQGKVIDKKELAVKQLSSNVTEVKKLNESYTTFASQDPNVLGGSKSGNGERDGDNARVVLDALPSKYDFPALISSLGKTFGAYRIDSIEGTDDEVEQSAKEASSNPDATEMPFSITLVTSPEQSTDMLKLFERSIRPIKVDKLQITAEDQQLKFTVDAKTYFQAKKKFEVTQERVK
jgi:hypothetical protein